MQIARFEIHYRSFNFNYTRRETHRQSAENHISSLLGVGRSHHPETSQKNTYQAPNPPPPSFQLALHLHIQCLVTIPSICVCIASVLDDAPGIPEGCRRAGVGDRVRPGIGRGSNVLANANWYCGGLPVGIVAKVSLKLQHNFGPLNDLIVALTPGSFLESSCC